MGEGFKKLKRQFWQSAIIKSAVCGFSFGLFAFAAVYIALNLAGIPLSALYYVLILLGGAALCGGLCILLFKPTDKKVAIELDKRHNLDEKVQSSLAFKDAQGAVVQMLQSDTEARLTSLPKEKFNFAKVWQYFLIGLLSVVIFVSAFFVPSNVVKGGTGDGEGGNNAVDSPYEFSDDELAEVLALIEDVKKSNLSTEVKNSTVESLNKLMNNLTSAELKSEKESFVNGCITSIESTIKGPLSYKALANAHANLAQNEIAKMIAEGVQTYKKYAIIEFSDVENFYNIKVTAVTENIKDIMSAFLEKLEEFSQESSEGEDESTDPAEGEDGEEENENSSSNKIVKIYTSIYTALNFSGVEDGDGLKEVLFDFAKGLAQNGNKLTNATAIAFDMRLNGELAEQAYLLATNKYVTNELRVIFGLQIPADENFVPPYSEESEAGKGPGSSMGGYGNGDMLYGSDDLVYDPITGEYVKYGELFNYYYAMVEAMLRDGNLTEDQKAVIRAYIEILLSGIKEE